MWIILRPAARENMPACAMERSTRAPFRRSAATRSFSTACGTLDDGGAANGEVRWKKAAPTKAAGFGR